MPLTHIAGSSARVDVPFGRKRVACLSVVMGARSLRVAVAPIKQFGAPVLGGEPMRFARPLALELHAPR